MTWRRRLALVVILASTEAFAEEVTFFDNGIDYWSTSERISEVQASAKIEPKSAAEKESFNWQTVMDPKNDEFFKEGDYTPPAPFMAVARDPSDHNVRMWNAYIERKNEVLSRLTTRLQEYAIQNGSAPAPSMVQAPIERQATSQNIPQDPKRFRIKMYFDSTCPHCQRMMTTLAGLSERGFEVEAKQIDQRPIAPNAVPFPVTHADPRAVKHYGISSVPFLLVDDLQQEVTYKMTGFKTADEMFGEISAWKKGGAGP